MKKTTFIKILENWDSMDQDGKLDALQKMENELAFFQLRKPRSILLSEDKKFANTARYEKTLSDNILVGKGMLANVFDALAGLTAAGFKAYIDDFFKRDQKLQFLGKADLDKLITERFNSGVINNFFEKEGLGEIASLLSYENELSKTEAYTYLYLMLLESIDQAKDRDQAQNILVRLVKSNIDAQARENKLQTDCDYKFHMYLLNKKYMKQFSFKEIMQESPRSILTDTESDIAFEYKRLFGEISLEVSRGNQEGAYESLEAAAQRLMGFAKKANLKK